MTTTPYSTADIGLAAALTTLDSTIAEMAPTPSPRGRPYLTFVFSDPPEACQKTEKSYYAGKLMVSALTYAYKLRQLKERTRTLLPA